MLSWLVDLGVFAGGADGGCEADGLRLRLTAVPSVGAGEVSMMGRGMAAASAGARRDTEEEEGPGKGSRKAEASPHTHAARAQRRNSGCPGVGECEIPSAQRQRLSPPTCSACPAGSELRHTYGTRVPPAPSHDGGPISATCPVLDHPLLKRRIDVRSLAHRSPDNPPKGGSERGPQFRSTQVHPRATRLPHCRTKLMLPARLPGSIRPRLFAAATQTNREAKYHNSCNVALIFPSKPAVAAHDHSITTRHNV